MQNNYIINKKNIKRAMCLTVIVMAVFLFSAHIALADEVNVGLEYAEQTGLGDTDPRIIAANIIRIFLGFLGIIAVGLITYAGWLWMSSEGNEEKIEKAKMILKNAIIGLVIALSSFAIASFILNKLLDSTSGSINFAGGPGINSGGIAALGSGIIESHYPTRNQKNLPRNTNIVITFKEAMDISTIMSGEDLNVDNVKIYKTIDGSTGSFVTDVQVSKTDDNKIFVFNPVQYLGSPSEKIWYSVALSNNIAKANGGEAFPGAIGEIAYDWSFEIGTFIDVTSPQIKSIVPQPDSIEPRNVVIQINFNEAIDPIAASGFSGGGFDNIVIRNETDNGIVAGNFYISNQYQTIEFLTENACGVNSCGDTVYCLPGDKNLSVLVKAATLTAIGESTANFPYNGIVDMASNSLDGNENGIAQGPESQSGLIAYNENNPSQDTQGDDYTWLFNTNNNIDITAPEIISIDPYINDLNVGLNVEPEVTFDKLIMSRSLNTSSITITSSPSSQLNYWIEKNDNSINKQTTTIINHDQFNENTNYLPQINSNIRDIYQNCYSPCSGLGVSGSPSCCNGQPSAVESCQ